MRTSGVLRRVVILIAFVWAYSHFVLQNGHFDWDPEVREWLHWLLYGAVAWGVVTLFADRFAESGRHDEVKSDENDGS